MRPLRYTPKTLLRELVLLVIAAVWVLPFYMLASVSLKSSGADVYNSPISPPSHPTLSNYPQAWNASAAGSLGPGFVSSFTITASSVVVLILFGSIAAYTLARRPGRFSLGLYAAFAVGLILPIQLGVIPLFAEMRTLGLVGTYAGMILLYSGTLMPLAVFLYGGFLRSLPREYEEAAQVDGALPLRTFIWIVFPLLRPATGVVAILCGLIIWNDFFSPLIFLSGSPNATLPVDIYTLVNGLGSQWNVIFAAVAISIIPLVVFFFVAQRQLLRGFGGGIKA